MYDQLNDRPPRGLHNWGVTYKDEPQKGKPGVNVCAWVPVTIARSNLGEIAGYLSSHLGWVVYRGSGWSYYIHGEDELALVDVKVRAREIRRALAEAEIEHPAAPAAAWDITGGTGDYSAMASYARECQDDGRPWAATDEGGKRWDT